MNKRRSWKHYKVVTTIWHNGNDTTVTITEMWDDEPTKKSAKMLSARCDTYIDWFDTRAEANDFAEDAMRGVISI